jgi:Ca2+-binding EF-hand superfamily protein
MLSDALRDRLITVLGVWDADRDGAIEESDYAVAAGRLAGLSGLKPGSAEYERLHGQLVNGGWQLLRQFDSNGDGRVSIEEALEGFDGLHADQQRYREVIIEPSYSAFDLIDTDHDGRITAEEYRAYLIAMSVDEATAATAFEHLDLNGDGFLSREEFVQLTDEFYTSDDPDAAGGWLYGKSPSGSS